MGWVVLHGCVVHVDVHRNVTCCGCMAATFIATEHGRCGLSCMQKLWCA